MAVAHGVGVLARVAATPPSRRLSPLALRQREQALALAGEEGLGFGAYSQRIVPLDEPSSHGPAGDTLCADGETLEAPWLRPESGTLTAVACGVATLGRRLEERVQGLFAEGRRSLALALDSLGNEFLFAVSRLMQDRMLGEARRQGLCMAGELRAGDPGLALSAQATVLRLARAESVGVSLTEGAMMRPVKTTSVVFGVGIALPEAHWSRCDHCPSRPRCRVAAGEMP